MTDPAKWFDGQPRVLFVHAHPDDETITTGGTLAGLAEAGREPLLVTLTRGERGEVVDGPFSALAGTADLAPHRQAELAAALAFLGVTRHAFLGVAPARVEGLPPAIYEDSGMEWSEADPPRAIPAASIGDDALTAVPVAEVIGDLLTAAALSRAGAIVSYDDGGGYGHPDHVLAHRVGRAVAHALEIPFWEIVGADSGDDTSTDTDADAAGDAEPVESHDVSPWLERKVAALRAHATQLTVDGDDIVHVGGQREPIRTVESFRRRAEVLG